MEKKSYTRGGCCNEHMPTLGLEPGFWQTCKCTIVVYTLQFKIFNDVKADKKLKLIQ